MKKKKWKVHVIAGCFDCEWRTENFLNGRARAALHAKTKKHKVWVDMGFALRYDGRVPSD